MNVHVRHYQLCHVEFLLHLEQFLTLHQHPHLIGLHWVLPRSPRSRLLQFFVLLFGYHCRCLNRFDQIPDSESDHLLPPHLLTMTCIEELYHSVKSHLSSISLQGVAL